MRKYNKYGASHKNVTKYEMEILMEKDGVEIPEDLLMIRCYTSKDECVLTFAPNMADKTIGLMLDRTTPFSDAVLEHLIKSGDAEKIMKSIYDEMGWIAPPQQDTSYQDEFTIQGKLVR